MERERHKMSNSDLLRALADSGFTGYGWTPFACRRCRSSH